MPVRFNGYLAASKQRFAFEMSKQAVNLTVGSTSLKLTTLDFAEIAYLLAAVASYLKTNSWKYMADFIRAHDDRARRFGDLFFRDSAESSKEKWLKLYSQVEYGRIKNAPSTLLSATLPCSMRKLSVVYLPSSQRLSIDIDFVSIGLGKFDFSDLAIVLYQLLPVLTRQVSKAQCNIVSDVKRSRYQWLEQQSICVNWDYRMKDLGWIKVG